MKLPESYKIFKNSSGGWWWGEYSEDGTPDGAASGPFPNKADARDDAEMDWVGLWSIALESDLSSLVNKLAPLLSEVDGSPVVSIPKTAGERADLYVAYRRAAATLKEG